MGLPYYESQTNFIMVKPKIDVAIFVQLLFDRGIMIRPVEDFGASGHVRITNGTIETNAALVKALGDLMASSK